MSGFAGFYGNIKKKYLKIAYYYAIKNFDE